MNRREQNLLRSEVGDAEPRLRVRSEERIDAGRWWRRSPVWLCVMDDALLALAAARRRYVDRIPFSECAGSRYQQVSGELVIGSGDRLPFGRFKVSPRDALRILELIPSDHPKTKQEQC